jgi:hypothetical protein
MDRYRALLCISFGVVYAHAVVGGCAKGGGNDTFGIEDESTSATSGAGTSDDPGHTSGEVSNGAATSGDSTTTGGTTTGGSTTGNPQTTGDCCVGGTNPGCSNPSIEQCVCAQDDYCCTTEWNDLCVDEVDQFGCGSCGGSSAASGSSGGNPQGACCLPSAGPRCFDDPSVEQCVCSQDAYCCQTAWDDTCVMEVTDFGCGAC